MKQFRSQMAMGLVRLGWSEVLIFRWGLSRLDCIVYIGCYKFSWVEFRLFGVGLKNFLAVGWDVGYRVGSVHPWIGLVKSEP